MKSHDIPDANDDLSSDMNEQSSSIDEQKPGLSLKIRTNIGMQIRTNLKAGAWGETHNCSGGESVAFNHGLKVRASV